MSKTKYDKRFWVFFAIATAINVTQFMSNGSNSVAITNAGVSPDMVGVITSIMGIVSFLMMVIAGPASVTFAPHKLWGFTCLGYAAAYVLMAQGSVPLYIVSKAIDGFVTGFQAPAMMMILRDCVGEDKIGGAMGLYQMRNSIAKVLGPILGLNGLCILLGYNENYYVCAGLMLVYAVLIFACMKLKNTEFKPAPFKLNPQTIVVKGGWLPLFIVVCVGMTQMGIGQFNTVYAKTVFGATNIGLMMSIGNICAIFLAPTITRLSDKLSTRKMLLVSFAIFAVGPVVYAFANSFVMCIVAACFQFVGFAVLAGVLQALLVRNAPAELSAVAGNTYGGGLNLGSFFGPLLAGQLVNIFGYRTMFLCMLAPIAVAIVLVFVYCARRDKTAADNS